MMTEGRYNNDDLLVRLRAVFGRVDQVRHHIDIALQQDDAHRRKRNMRFLMLPTRFPRPESMGQGDIAVWTNWIREETDEIMKQLEEERDSRSDPGDPFNGTANGVFQPLQDPLSLPPPVQMPKRQGNNSEDLEHSHNLWEYAEKQNTVSKIERRNETVTPAQGEPRKFREHSRESLDPMESIRNLHMQQRQNQRSTQEQNKNTPSAPQTPRIEVNQEEANLITFSPVVEQQVPSGQGATGFQEQPKRERSPRKKKNSELALNQRQFDHSKTKKFPIFYLVNSSMCSMERRASRTYNCQSKRNKKTVSVPDVVKWDTEDAIVKSTHGANFASWILMPHKLVASMKNL